MTRTFAILTTAMSLCVPTAALAQERNPDETIVIEGTTIVEGADARQQARDISFPLESNAEAFARFQRPVCVGVWGLQPDNARAVISRIYDNAEAAGIDIDETPGCGANVWIVVVESAARTFKRLRDENSWMVRPLTKFERKRIKQQEGPVRAWNLTTVRDDNGEAVPTGSEVGAASQLARTLGEPLPSAKVRWASRIQNATRRDIEMSIVLIERKALGEVDAHSLADYATMRALGRTEEPEKQASYETILNLFDAGAPAQRLSAFDRAYLRSLYHANPYRSARMGLASLKTHMEEELAEEEAQAAQE